MGWPWLCRHRRWDVHLVGSVGAQRQGQAREAWLIHSPALLPSEAEHHGRLGMLEDIGQPAHVTADAQVQLSPVATEHRGAGATLPGSSPGCVTTWLSGLGQVTVCLTLSVKLRFFF